MLIAHDLLLLLLEDTSGKKVPLGLSDPDQALAGAVLVELAQLGLVDVAGDNVAVAGDNATVKPGRIVVRPAEPPTEPVLRGAFDIVRTRAGAKPEQLLGPLAKGLRAALVADLVQAGVLRREPHKVLGLFPVTRLPAVDSSCEASLRTDLAAVLSGAREPDARTGPLIGLLSALNATKVVEVPDQRDAARRAKEIARGDWAAAAVRKAIRDMQAATSAAIMAGGATSAAAGS